MHTLDYSVYIRPQEHPTLTPPPGSKAFLVETVDEVDDDHGYAGFFGPADLLDDLSTEQAAARLSAWIAYAVVSQDDQTSEVEYAQAALNSLTEGSEAYVRTGTSTHPGKLLFQWSEQQPLQKLAKRAVTEQRALDLDAALPSPSRKSPGPRF